MLLPEPNDKTTADVCEVELTNIRSLVGDTVLGGSTFEAISLAPHSLFLLPQTAQVEGAHVVEPLGQSWHLQSDIIRTFAS